VIRCHVYVVHRGTVFILLCMYLLCIVICIVLLHRFEKRLLQPGANTSDIITQYISSIKVIFQYIVFVSFAQIPFGLAIPLLRTTTHR